MNSNPDFDDVCSLYGTNRADIGLQMTGVRDLYSQSRSCYRVQGIL